jgi:hypothetical protein
MWLIIPPVALSNPHFLGGYQDGIDNVLVTGATAQITRDRLPYFLFVRPGVVFEKRKDRHQETRRAKPALKSMGFPESFL